MQVKADNSGQGTVMKIKRYFAPDIRQAIRKVRDEQGPDAVILSNQRVNGGIEIVAAVDYDESLFRKNMMPQDTTLTENPDIKMQIQKQDSNRMHNKDEFTGSNTSRQLSDVIWSQDPAIVEIQDELRKLRDMLENQLSGLAWGDLNRRYPQRADLMRRLMKIGLSTSLCQEISNLISSDTDIDHLWGQALTSLVDRVPIMQSDLLTDGGVVALIGPTGVGKTTTIAKIASRYTLRHGNRDVALVTIDNYRVGAYEQLRTYGRILDIPVKNADSRQELKQVLNDLKGRRLILIDTAGMGQHDHHLINQADIIDSDASIRTSLLLSATTRLSGLEDVVQAFEIFNPTECMFTKIDEATSLGNVLSIAIKHNLPVSYVSNGQQVPEDLQRARAHTLVSQCVALATRAEKMLEEEVAFQSYGRVAANAHG